MDGIQQEDEKVGVWTLWAGRADWGEERYEEAVVQDTCNASQSCL